MEVQQVPPVRQHGRGERQREAKNPEVQTNEQDSGAGEGSSDGREAQMADQQQETNQNQVGDLSQQISDAIQPVMNDLQEQITQTVQQQFEQTRGGVSSNGVGTLSLDNLGPLGETLQSSLDGAVDRLQPFFQWVLEMLQKLVNWVMSLFGGGGKQSSEGAQTQGS